MGLCHAAQGMDQSILVAHVSSNYQDHPDQLGWRPTSHREGWMVSTEELEENPKGMQAMRDIPCSNPRVLQPFPV